jgi:hypothetical protein
MTIEERAGLVWLNKRPDGIEHLNGYIVMEERKLPIHVTLNPAYNEEINNPYFLIYWRKPFKNNA